MPNQRNPDGLFAAVAALRRDAVDLAHECYDQERPLRTALVEMVGRLDDLAVRLRDHLGADDLASDGPGSRPEPSPHRTEVGERIRHNSARHRSAS